MTVVFAGSSALRKPCVKRLIRQRGGLELEREHRSRARCARHGRRALPSPLRARRRSRARVPCRRGGRRRSDPRGRSARTHVRGRRPRARARRRCTASLPAAATISTVPPSAVQRMAFSTRFESACSARPASAIAPAGGSTRSIELDAVDLRLMRVAGDRLGRDLAEVDRARAITSNDAPPQPREVEQVADQPLEPTAPRARSPRRRGRARRRRPRGPRRGRGSQSAGSSARG